jgi:hypothetical protein
MPPDYQPNPYSGLLRGELRARNATYADSRKLPHTLTYGNAPVVVYQPSSEARCHGNFIEASYRAILRLPAWKRRLEKVHTNAARSLPRSERKWKELDSCMSSDALLMNIFCYPGTLRNRALRSLLGIDDKAIPEFGFKARVPLLSGRLDRTEVDMKLGTLLVESKLTEANFQTAKPNQVDCYRDLQAAFDMDALPKESGCYTCYQLIRNVLAAYALGLNFCVLLDARRPDLRDSWYGVISSIRSFELKTRCKVLTWQELSTVLPKDLQLFLDLKYGIVPPGSQPSEVADSD